MKSKKKLYFFNDRYKDYPKWIFPTCLVAFVIFFVEVLDKIAGHYIFTSYTLGLLYIPLLAYFIFKSTRKNAFHWVKDNEFYIIIKGKKLEVDARFLSDYYIENDVLHVIRINRLDKFPVGHLREQDLKKMLHLIEIQQYDRK
jgi:predicted house-cleaning noncanonical NTP pyrophosphatase (MazG superfamily)